VLGILAARLARAVYHLLRKQEAFDEERFFSGLAQQQPAPAEPSKPSKSRKSSQSAGSRRRTGTAAR
jgi:hypothetical protein